MPAFMGHGHDVVWGSMHNIIMHAAALGRRAVEAIHL